MKIASVEALYLKLPVIQARTDSSQDALIIKITTDSGLVGWGEVDGSPHVTKAIVEAPYSHTIATGLRHILLGENPLEIGRLWKKMYDATLYYGREGAVIQAMAGIDLALWDIKGKALGLPVHQLLGAKYADRIRVYASSLFRMTPRETADRAKALADTGYAALKFGWEPFGKDLKSDLAYLDAIRAAIGPDVNLMIDVGLVWDAKTTINRCRAFEPYDLMWVEEPLHPDHVDSYRKVARSVATPIAAGEEECTTRGFTHLIEFGEIDIAQIDVTRCGLTQAMEIAAIAHRNGLRCANHNFTTDINTAASLHLLAAIPNALILEYCLEPSEIRQSLVKRPIEIVDGFARVPTEPGLGVEPDPQIIAKYLVKN
jgi:L-alanine-DL-glutamate epimerase-like enolase superfamily enzyme